MKQVLFHQTENEKHKQISYHYLLIQSDQAEKIRITLSHKLSVLCNAFFRWIIQQFLTGLDVMTKNITTCYIYKLQLDTTLFCAFSYTA